MLDRDKKKKKKKEDDDEEEEEREREKGGGIRKGFANFFLQIFRCFVFLNKVIDAFVFVIVASKLSIPILNIF